MGGQEGLRVRGGSELCAKDVGDLCHGPAMRQDRTRHIKTHKKEDRSLKNRTCSRQAFQVQQVGFDFELPVLENDRPLDGDIHRVLRGRVVAAQTDVVSSLDC